MATETGQKRVGLTCKCGTSYTLNTIQDLPNRCINNRCRATLDMSDEPLEVPGEPHNIDGSSRLWARPLEIIGLFSSLHSRH